MKGTTLSSIRRVAITLLVMLLTTASAIAENSYWLTLDDNYEGGASTMVPVSIYANTFTLTEKLVPARAGEHTFLGWSTSSTGDVEYKTGDKVTLDGSLTLYAIWDFYLSYSITDAEKKQVEVSGYKGVKPRGTFSIPATVTINGIEYSVTSIGENAFENCDNLQSVTIPNSVTCIGEECFRNCTSLQSVIIPESVTNIEKYVFKACTSLQSVTIPNSVTRIGDAAFDACTSLLSITIPNSVTTIGDNAFGDCSNLETVTIYGNPNIGTYAFWGVLANVTMNLTASRIGNDYWTTFYNDGYNFQADENTTVYKATVNGSSLMLTEVEDRIVNRGTAVILKSSGNPVMTLTGSGSSDIKGNDLRGRSDRTLRTDVIANISDVNTIYTMGNTSAGFGFHRYTGEYVSAGEAFLPLYIDDEAMIESFIIVPSIVLPTSIKPVSSDKDLQKHWFTISGARLGGKPSHPGVYINGNKKVMIK